VSAVNEVVFAGDIFLSASLTGLILSPLVGASVGWNDIRIKQVAAATVVIVGSMAFLAFSWRQIPGGTLLALWGHVAFLVSAATLAQLGRLLRAAFGDQMQAALLGLLAATTLIVLPFALGALVNPLSLRASTWLLAANPLVTIASAAGIDLLHLDLIYRLSPLAHRGVDLPSWTTASSVFAVLGLAGYGVSCFAPQERFRQ
jgi:hypothetical protein